MDSFKKLRNILFLDIETVSCTPAYTDMNDRLKEMWDIKAGYISPESGSEEVFSSRAAIYAEFGKIVCIGAGFFFKEEDSIKFKVRSFAHHDEEILLKDFSKLLEKKFEGKPLHLCAHNGKEFDFPYICRRMVVNHIPLPPCLDNSGKKPWEVTHLDTMEMWKFGDRKSYTSLELMAALFNIPGSKGEMDGSKVTETYYQKKNLEKIKKYCMEDVIVTAQLFLRLNNFPILPKNNIIYSQKGTIFNSDVR